jgi:hypothetical protein
MKKRKWTNQRSTSPAGNDAKGGGYSLVEGIVMCFCLYYSHPVPNWQDCPGYIF